MDLDKLKKFYKNKKVFITGNTGFKGIWLQLFLIYLGAKVKGYSLKKKKMMTLYFTKKLKKNVKKLILLTGIYLIMICLKKLLKILNRILFFILPLKAWL
tara:strand:- start:239 stop:538 length:300 start_codon:yes stop_codon:yes gene_type:complete